MAYLLPEGQIDWITGIATLNDDELMFTWNVSGKVTKSSAGTLETPSLKPHAKSLRFQDKR